MFAETARRVRTAILSSLFLGLLIGAFLPTSARASGIDIPENGALVLGRGGTDVGLLNTAYALQFNPAGMTFGTGLDVRVETLMIGPGETYNNCPSGSPASCPSTALTNGQASSTSNTAGVQFGPQVMITYHPPKLKWFAFGAGVWGPPGVINFKFADPRPDWTSMDKKTQANSTTSTPERYQTISQSSIIFYPSVGFAFRPIPQISIGATLQYVIASMQLSTELGGLPSILASHPNTTQNDVITSLDVNGQPQVTGIVGIVANPIPNLMISASFRPQVAIDAKGTMGIALGNDVNALGVQIKPPKPDADLRLNLPPIVRAGVAYQWNRLSTALEYVWEGWSVNKQFLLSSSNGQVTVPSLGLSTPVGTTAIPNEWNDTSSGRVGFGYDFVRPGEALGKFSIQGELGFLFDQNAIPAAYQRVPFLTGNLFGPTVGASLGWNGLALNMGFVYYIPQTINVTNTSYMEPTSPPPAGLPPSQPVPAADGSYHTNIWAMSIGLSYTGFGG